MTRPLQRKTAGMRERPTGRARDFLTRLGRDQRGVSAIEFALIAPVMIILYFAIAEFSQGYMAQKRLVHSASAVADLVARTNTVSMNDLDDVIGVSALIMKPFSATSLTTRVSGVTRDANGVAKVNWSRASGIAAYKPNDVVTVPTDMIGNGASLIMSEATYDYASPVKFILPAATRMSSTIYALPRMVVTVTCTDCPTS